MIEKSLKNIPDNKIQVWKNHIFLSYGLIYSIFNNLNISSSFYTWIFLPVF